jgi:hypothetical protein
VTIENPAYVALIMRGADNFPLMITKQCQSCGAL